MLDFSLLPHIFRVTIARDGRVTPCPICGGDSKSCVIKIDEDGNERIGCFRSGCELKRPKTIHQFLDEYGLWNHALQAKSRGWQPLSYVGRHSFSQSLNSITAPPNPINPTIYTVASQMFEQDLQLKLGYQVRNRGHKLATLRHFHIGYVSPFRNYAEELRVLGKETGLWSYDELTESGLFCFSKQSKFGACAIGRGLFSYPIYQGEYVRTIKYKGVDQYGEKFQCSLAVEDTGNDFPYFLNPEGLKAETPILVEGENDMLSMWEADYQEAVCLFGGLKQRQVEYMDLSKTYLLGFDHDEPDDQGKRAGEEHTKKAQKMLPNTQILKYPAWYHDPDDWCKDR